MRWRESLSSGINSTYSIHDVYAICYVVYTHPYMYAAGDGHNLKKGRKLIKCAACSCAVV